jgi:bla regulator protein BlaR1
MSSGAIVHFSVEWGAALWRASWQGGLAITAVWIVCHVAPRIRPDLQCWLWRLAYLKLFVALIWATPFKLPLLPVHSTIEAEAGARGDGLLTGPEMRSALTLAGVGFNPGRAVAAGLIALWALGFLWCVWQVIREALEIRRLRRRCRAVCDSDLIAECEALSRQLGVKRLPELSLQDGPGTPVLIGMRDASIVLPESFLDDYDRAQRRLILAHELAHVKRADFLWAWLARSARCIFFFHPLVWLAESEWQQSQEMACDRHVLQLDEVSRSTYGAVLLHVVQQPRRLRRTQT